MITGTAGSGKSGVVRRLISLLGDAGVPHLAFRVDHHLTCQRPEEFGKSVLGRNERPTITLKGIAPDQPSVLIVDQVDAVSEVSGRNGVVRNALLQLLDGLYALRTVRVVFVCRNYDFDNDPRLKSLRDSQHENRFEVPLLDWETEISPLVETKGYEPEIFTPAQRGLLRLPLNLAVYLEVAGDSPSFASRDDLFRALVRKKDRDLRRDRNVPWPIMQVMEALADWMSNSQRLEAPENVLDGFPEARDILSSEGLIVVNRQHVNFFHESFFDFAYAQAFARSSKSLYEMLVSSEQHLFRRTQCRQILEVMRQQDMLRYLDTLSRVLKSPDIRFHIKLAITQWLGNLPDPTNEERNVVLKLDDVSKSFSILVDGAAFRSAGWFDLHVANGWLQSLLNDPLEQRRNAAFWSVVNAASDRPTEVANVLREWWGGDATRGETLFGCLANFRRVTPNADLERLFVDVIRSKPPGIFSYVSARGRKMIFVIWMEKNSERGAPLLKAFLDTWFDMHPGDHPFRHDTIKALDLYSMGKLSEKAPVSFLEATFEAFLRTLRIIGERKANGEWDSTFATLTYSGRMIGGDEFLQFLRSALRAMAESAPKQASAFLSRLPTSLHPVALHIHLNTTLGNPRALKDHFMLLLNEVELFDCRWHGAEWKSFADAAAAVFPHLAADEKIAVEQAVFRHNPEYRRAQEIAGKIDGEDGAFNVRADVIYWLNEAGHTQWCILTTIGEDNLSPQGKRHFAMLERKFPKRSLPEQSNNEMYVVGSPINFEHAEHMSDDQWLKAIEKYGKERDFSRRPIRGGPRELGQILKKCAKEDLARFVALLEKIPDAAAHTYISNILWAIIEHEDPPPEAIKVAILNVHSRPGRPYGGDIARIISRMPKLADDDEIFAILMFYAEQGSAEEESEVEKELIERETASIRELMDYGQSLRISGVNGARGEAAEALEYVLWNLPDRTEEISNFVEQRVDTEPLVSIRCALMGPLKPLYNHNREKCGELVERLVSAYSKAGTSLPAPSSDELTPLGTRDGIDLFPYLLFGAPDAARRMLARLGEAESKFLQVLAAFHVIRSSLALDEFRDAADLLIEQGGHYRVLAAEIAARMISVAEYQDRVCMLLVRFFNDEDEVVRKMASSVFLHADPAETANADVLLSAYLESPAFDGEDFSFFEFLKKTNTPVVNHLVVAAEKLISERAEAESSQWGYRDFGHLYELIQIEYAASEHNPDLRRRLLDIIDRCLEQGINGAESILSAHDRAA